MSVKKSTYFFLIAVLVITTGAGIWLSKADIGSSRSLPVLADFGADFELTGPGNKRVQLKDYRDQVVIIFFGYTYCPDVCPTGLYTLQHVMQRLGKQSTQVQVLMITVDPERDTVEHLQKYVTHFHSDFIGLTGSLEDITRVTKAYLTDFKKEAPAVDGSYQVSHNAYFYILDKKARVRVLHDPVSTPEQIAVDIRSLLDEGNGFFN
jgi:protein SCO1/2